MCYVCYICVYLRRENKKCYSKNSNEMGGKSYVLCCAQILSHIRQFAMHAVGPSGSFAMEFSGNKTVVGCHFHLQGSSDPRSDLHFLPLMSPCIDRWLVYHWYHLGSPESPAISINNMEKKAILTYFPNASI